jgi:hypothetical protein
MLLNNKPIDKIEASDLQALIDNEVAESKTIEYKEKLSDNSDGNKKEFLYDVSSFANASGGNIIYGMKARMEEDKSAPTELIGLDISDVDEVIRGLEEKILQGIRPRIPGLSIHQIVLENNKTALIIQIPRSFAQPHMVIYQNASKFYSRTSKGKYQLDVDELRTAFTLSQSITDRIRDFRRERLSAIVADETPVLMESGAKLVLHIIPISAFDPASMIDMADIDCLYRENDLLFLPLPLKLINSWHRRYNIDGYLNYCQLGESSISNSYLQVFRNGIIEACTTSFAGFSQKKDNFFIYKDYEEIICEGLFRFLEIQNSLVIEPPIFIFLTIISVKNYVMGYEDNFGRSFGHPIDRDILLLPEVIIEDYKCDIPQVMKPIFDAVWNAAGFPRSLNYDDEGKWIGGVIC